MANLSELIAKQRKATAIKKLAELSKQQTNAQSPVPPLDLVIPHDVYDAFLTYHGNAAVKQIVEQCRITVESGAKVYFVTSYVNAPREINRVFRTKAEVDAWETAMSEAYEKSERK